MNKFLAVLSLVVVLFGPQTVFSAGYSSPTFEDITVLGNAKISGLPGASANVQSTGTPGLDFTTTSCAGGGCGWMLYATPSAYPAANPALLRVQKSWPSAGGGISGNVYPSAWVLGTTGENDQGYIWNLQSQIYNRTKASTGAQNIAIAGTIFKQYGSSPVGTMIGPSWALYGECNDKTGVINPTASCIGAEIDTYAAVGSGTDTNKQRVMLQLNGAVDGGNDTGVHIGRGILMGASGGATIDNAIEIDDANGTNKFLVEGNGSTTITSSKGSWANDNAGKTLLLTSPPTADNPAIGISDSNQTNWWALANYGGELRIQSMPALTDSTTVPTAVAKFARNGDVTVPSLLIAGGLASNTAHAPSAAAVSAYTSDIWFYSTWSGSVTQASQPLVASGYVAPLNFINVASDALDASRSDGNWAGVAALELNHNFGGATAKGSRAGLNVGLTLASATGNTAGKAYYNGIQSTVRANATDCGTISVACGDVYGESTQVSIAGQYYASVHGDGEHDLEVAGGASVINKIGSEITLNFADAVQGANMDVALLFGNRGSTAWKYLIELGFPSGQGGSFPLASNGTILGSYAGGSAANGIDLSNISFSGCAFKGNGFCVATNGAIGAKGVGLDGRMSWNNSAASSYPPTATTTAWLGDNFTSSAAEVDFWNADTAATASFNFYQMTGASAQTLVLSLTPTSAIFGGGIRAASLPTSCSGKPTGTLWNNSNAVNLCP